MRGWCPAGRLAEDGRIADRYPLVETPTSVYAERTEWNARDCDGTLVLTVGPPSEGTAYTVAMAEKHGRSCLIVDVDLEPDVQRAIQWIWEEGIHTLNVAGPRASKIPGMYQKAYGYLRRLVEEFPEDPG